MGPRRFQRNVAREVRSATEERPATLQVKDLVVLIPLFATSLAISWEVGVFAPTGGFLYFSLSEHLLAALQALPIALFFSVWLALAVAWIPLRHVHDPLDRVLGQSRWKMLAKFVVAVIVIGLGGWLVYKFPPPPIAPRDGFLLFSAMLMLAVGVANTFWLRRPWSSPVILSLFGGALIVAAMMLGIYQTLVLLDFLKRGTCTHCMATIVSKNDSSKGFVLMSGERGLLIYFPDGDRFSFQKADEFQRIDWQRGTR